MKKIITSLVALSFLTGCASIQRGSAYVPLVDMKNHTHPQFNVDLEECQVYATKRADAAAGAMAGAIAGALLGAILAPRGYRNNIAGRGALLGAAGGAGEANQTQEQIIKTCLAGRGYNVLN